MTVGSRIVFMRFATARSSKLQLWTDHFERLVGNGAERPIPGAAQDDDGAFDLPHGLVTCFGVKIRRIWVLG